MWARTMDAGRFLPSFDGRRDANMSLLEDATWYMGFPGFHVMGVVFGMCLLFLEKTTTVLGPPEMPANGKTIVDMMARVDFDFLMCAPTLFDDVVKNHLQEFVNHSASLKGIFNAGGPLSPTTGDFLALRVDVVHMYGQTEAGKISTLVSERRDWQWFEFNFGYGGLEMEKVQGTEDMYELIIRRMPGQEWCQAVFTTQPHLDVWRTRDLFRKHPTRNLYSFEGRVDDVLVLNNGEKFNPIIMEGIIQSDPLVTGALVAGQSKDQLCVIIETSNESMDKGRFIDKVWPTIEKANKNSPGHARIYRYMVGTTSPDKPFPRTSKATIQRSAAIKLYAQDIEALYEDRKTGSRPPDKGMPTLKLPKPAKESISDFVRQSVVYQSLEGEDISDTDDFYSLGFDSLQTSQLAKSLSEAFAPHMPPSSSGKITTRLIYENPTIQLTTEAIFAKINGHKPADINQTVLKHMRELVQRYTGDLPQRVAKSHAKPSGELHIAVTGTTGFLGFHLLQVLLGDDAVGRITCLNRSPAAADKFHDQNKAGKTSSADRIEFLQASFGKQRLGLHHQTYQKLVDEVNIIIHNAWQVDFNRTLASFEDPHLIGTRTLLEWALTSPRNVQMMFVSSVATVTYWPGYHPANSDAKQNETGSTLVSERPPDFSRIPSGQMGYAQSKYVAEAILTHAATQHNLSVTIIRPGQITDPVHRPGPHSGDTDWFPSMIRTSRELGLLPQALMHNKLIDFIPVDHLAETIVDIVHVRVGKENFPGDTNPAVYNLVNPYPVTFDKLIPAISDHLARNGETTKTVSMQEWIEALKSHTSDASDKDTLTQYPSLKLLSFWEAMAESISSGKGEGGIDTTNGSRVSEAMRDMKPVTGENVVSWMRNWGT